MDISISIVNYNTKGLLKICLESIFRNLKNDLKYEVIVADNNSADESLKLAKTFFTSVRYIENKMNLGFAKATNQTIRISQARYILLLNPDTEVIDGAIQRMYAFMEECGDIGILGSKLIMPGNIIHMNCSPYPWLLFLLENPLNLFRLPRWIRERIALSRWDYASVRDVDWLLGSCLMVRKEVFDKIGLLDERFFMYTEDMELCYRAKKSGFRITYMPNAEILHHQNISGSKEFGDKKRIIEYISVQKLFSKYKGSIGLLLGFTSHITGIICKISFYALYAMVVPKKGKYLRESVRLNLTVLIQIIKLGPKPEY